jgi:SAM-dependent methyltransferase
MSKNSKTPIFPDSYIGKKSIEYDSSIWMERNQKRTTIVCIQYLFDNQLDMIGNNESLQPEAYTILDLGCGTGFSSEILASNEFRVIGIEILPDMMAIIKKKLKSKLIVHDKQLFFLLADINNLPFRTNSFDHAISVSAYNFIINNQQQIRDKQLILNNTAKAIYKILKFSGRIIIEFYPNDEKELNLFLSSFRNNKFDGFYIKKNPNQKAGQTFLLLKKR